MIGWIMKEIRLLACLLSLFIISNSSVCAMTAVQGNTGTETDLTENEKVSFEKEGAKNKSWNKIRNVVNVRQRIRQKNDSSKIFPNDSEEDFDDTKTIFEEDDELNDTVDTKSEKGGLKRSDSSMTLYDESINSDNDEDTKSEKAESKNESAQSGNKLLSVIKARQRLKDMASKGSGNDQKESDSDEEKTSAEKGTELKKDKKTALDEEDEDEIDEAEDIKSEKAESKNESAQSGNKLLSVIKARQRLKDMASKGSGNNQKESDSDEEKTSAEKDAELKKDKKTALDEEDEIDEAEDTKSEKAERKSDPDEKKASVETDVNSKKDAKSDSGEEKTSTEKGTELKKDKKTALDEEDEDEIDEAEDTKAERVAIKTPAEIKFPLKISGIKKFGEVSSASPSYRRVYRDNDPEAYETPTIRRRYTFSDGDNRYSMNRTGNRNRRSSLEGTLRRSLDFSSLQKNLSGGDGDSDEDSQDQQADDSENGTEGEETSTSDVSQDVMPMTNTALPMQQPDQTMNLVANENMNNQMVMQQAPYQIPATQQNMPVASGNIQTNPSFGESFLQNLFHTNQSDQNTSNSETKTRRGRRNRFISGIQNAYGIGKAGVQNMYGGVREVGRNLSDSEVVEKVIRYLRDLGVINESKFLKLNLKDIGTCVYCRKFSLLTMLDKEKKLGVCKTCSDQLVGDYLSGKLLGGDRYAANGYRRDSGVDIADDMVRGGINELKKEGSLEKTLSLGNIAAALGSTILNKGSSANPNEQMSQNAFGQPLMPGALPPDQIIGGGIVPGQLGVVEPQLMNQPGMPGGAMPLDQTQMLNSGAGALVGGAALGQASNFGMMGQTSNLGMNPSMTAMGTTGTGTGTGILSNIGRYGKVAAGVALGAAALGTGAAIWNAVKSKGKGATTEQMVLNEKGELVPLSSWNNPNAPYGYKIDPATGALVPAASAEEGLAVAQEVAATQEAANNTGTGTSNGNSKLKTAAKIAAGVAAGAAVAGAGVAAYKAWKKSKADKAEKGDEKDTDKTKSSGDSDEKDTDKTKSNGESDKKSTDTTKKDDSSKESSSETQKNAPKELSPEEKKKTEEKIEDLEGDIKEVQEKIKSIEQEKQEKQKEYDDYKAKGKRVKMSVVEKEIEKLDESLKQQKENLEELQKDQKALKEKLNGDQSKSEPVKTEESKSETGKAA
ncbi:MAG: hypothetical protein K5766_00125 [Alphaproteobacteria bacterium]|nr:hypothetical protein [Alphaproteobacteria bacterium]